MQSGYYTLFLLTLVVSGYILATFCYGFRYKTAREAGHRLYLTSGALGFAVMIGCEMIVLTWSNISPYINRLIPFDDWFGAEINRMLTLSIMGPIAATIATYVYNAFPNSKNTNMHRAWSTDDFSALVAYATREFLPIAITLENRKVYVGLIARTSEPQHDSAHITLLPLFSGHRDDRTLSMSLTNEYTEVFDVIENAIKNDGQINIDSLKKFYLVAPLEKINIAHIFNYELYKRISDQSLPAQT